MLANQTKTGVVVNAQQDFCEWLNAKRADPNHNGGLPLKLAIGCANVAMVEHLLWAKADPSMAERLFKEKATPGKEQWTLVDDALRT